MALIEHYAAIKHAHIALVAASGSLFALRGLGVLAEQRWPMVRPLRLLSYGIDTLLLAAGVTMWTLLRIDPVTSPWLGTKLLLLVLYVVLGSIALKRARSGGIRFFGYAAAVMTFLFMAGVALRHHPAGFFFGIPHPPAG